MILDIALSLEFTSACRKLLRDRPNELRFIEDHERRYVVLKNLSQQIHNYERAFRHKAQKEHRDRLVTETAKMFIVHALKHWDDKQISEAKRLGIERKVNHAEEERKIAEECFVEVRDEVQTQEKK